MVPWVGLQSVIVVLFPGHTYLLLNLDQARRFDLEPICLQRLSADDTSRQSSEVPRPWKDLATKPSSNIFTDHPKAMLLLWILLLIYVSCLSLYCLVCSLLPCDHLLGIGADLLALLCVTFSCVLVSCVRCGT